MLKQKPWYLALLTHTWFPGQNETLILFKSGWRATYPTARLWAGSPRESHRVRPTSPTESTPGGSRRISDFNCNSSILYKGTTSIYMVVCTFIMTIAWQMEIKCIDWGRGTFSNIQKGIIWASSGPNFWALAKIMRKTKSVLHNIFKISFSLHLKITEWIHFQPRHS